MGIWDNIILVTLLVHPYFLGDTLDEKYCDGNMGFETSFWELYWYTHIFLETFWMRSIAMGMNMGFETSFWELYWYTHIFLDTLWMRSIAMGMNMGFETSFWELYTGTPIFFWTLFG